MNNKIIIYGMGDFSDILTEKLLEKCIEVSAYTVNENYLEQEHYRGKPVYPFEKLEQYFVPENTNVYIGFIGKKMFKFRKEVYKNLEKRGYRLPNYIADSAKICTVKIGQGNIIMENVVVENHCSVGNCNIIWPNVVLPHHNQIGDFNNLSPSVSFSGYSKVGNQCFIGNNACLNNGVKVCDRALVGAGTFVAKDLQEEQVLVSERSYVLKGKKSYDFR